MDHWFDQARAETIRYHRDLYASTPLGSAGTWLAAPQRAVLDAIARVDDRRPVVAYDLGAGIGRHTIPLLQMLPAGSTVIAVDLIPDALEVLRRVAPDTPNKLVTIAADLEQFSFDQPADIVIAVSAIEHVSSPRAVRDVLRRIAAAMSVGGIVHLGLVCDRYEVHGLDDRRPAFLESNLTAADGCRAVDAAFVGFDVVNRLQRKASTAEERDGGQYELMSTLVSVTLQRGTPAAR